MNESVHAISFYPVSMAHVSLALVLVALAAGLARLNRSGLERQYLWGAVRSFVQLWAVGYVLVWLFGSRNPLILGAAVEFQILMGTYTAGARQKNTALATYLALCAALHVSVILTGVFVYSLVLNANPFEAPHLLIPIMGMVIGNAANGAALSVHRLQGEVASHQGEIEAALALGASPQKALEPFTAATLRNALIPSLNSMMLMGIVQLPGMMTGQMIAGVVPHQAIRYQIIIVYMLAGAVALTCHLTVHWESQQFFTSRWGLKSNL